MTAFDFDLEITNSRIYQRAMADDARRASSVGTIRAPIPDRFQIPEERDEDNPEPFPEQATVPRLYDKDVKGLRFPVKPQWPLRDEQPASTRDVSQLSGLISPSPSDAGAVATIPHAVTVNTAVSQISEPDGAQQVVTPSFMSRDMEDTLQMWLQHTIDVKRETA
jgi:hypothetical protein